MDPNQPGTGSYPYSPTPASPPLPPNYYYPPPPQPTGYDEYGDPQYANQPNPYLSPQPPPAAPTAGYQPQPVAYDEYGNPLYLRQEPVYEQPHTKPPHEREFVITPEITQLHEESRNKYPHLNLTQGEYVLSVISRHPVGMFKIWLGGLLLIGAFLGLYLSLFSNPDSSLADMAGLAATVLGGMIVLAIVGIFAMTIIYTNNRLYITNESIIEETQQSLVAKHEQTVSLLHVEDVSYTQSGALAMMFDYGAIQFSTEGDETTYLFQYAPNPKHQVDIANNAIEAAQTGRPVELPHHR